MKKKEFIILATVMACALLAMAVLHYGRNNKGAYVEVVVDNEVIEQYSLMKDGVYEITGHNGGENVLHIEDGCAYISEATCPDKLCVEQKEISKEGEMLVCLPNRVIVKAVGKEKIIEHPYDFLAKVRDELEILCYNIKNYIQYHTGGVL